LAYSSIAHFVVYSLQAAKTKQDAEAQALATAPNELRRALMKFSMKLKDFNRHRGEGRTQLSLLGDHTSKSLADAALHLAETVKITFPAHRVAELIRLDLELDEYATRTWSQADPSPALKEALNDAIVLCRELCLVPVDAVRSVASGRRRPRAKKKAGHASAGYDMLALKLAKAHDEKGNPWTIASIARELALHPATLNGRNSQGRHRCPTFMRLAQRVRRTKISYQSDPEGVERND
jgi:hypothetical protein